MKVIKDSAIKNISFDFIKAAGLSLKRIRTKVKLIIDALYIYFINNTSTRAISNFFKDRYGYYASHVSI
jgi:hypothetical protein